MASLLTCQSLAKSFNTRILFENLSLGIADGERCGLIGPNGSGKSTLLRLMAGLDTPDDGAVVLRRGVRVGLAPQEDTFDAGATAEAVLMDALAALDIEAHEQHTRAAIMLGKCGFERGDVPVAELSGGWRKRLSLARQLIQDPDVLLLDEPTNHLDVEGILWLEELLSDAGFAWLVVTHDRWFLERVTTRVVELNPVYAEGCYSVAGPYSVFIAKRAEFLEAQSAQQRSLAIKVRREIDYLKQGPKAQRTKEKSRFEEADRMTAELADLRTRNQSKTAGIEFETTGRQTRQLLVAKGIAKRLGGKLLFSDVDVALSPGSRLGLLGRNGSGKTTLIRVLTGELAPDAGSLKRADDLRVVVFDQQREQLPRELPLKQALCGASETVEFAGQAVHFSAWMRRFLFRADQVNMTVGELSGGEQARILIARLMLRPADVLILDEPTNDLDIDSLELLEESLDEFPGAVILVTHDRFMLERVSSEILGLHGDGRVGNYGTVDQWLAVQEWLKEPAAAAKEKPKPRRAKGPAPYDPRRLTAEERFELDQMETSILAAETEAESCRGSVADPAIAANFVELQTRCAALAAAEERVKALYARWEELEAKQP